MIMLIFVGRQLEEPLGKRVVAALLLAGTLAGSFFQWAADPGSMVPVIGASGAISALFACYALIFSSVKTRAIGPFSPAVVRAAWLGAFWIGLQLALGLASGGAIAIWAHIGGFLAGLVLTRGLLRRRFRT
jgi:membrane associated rhomboid family serine protease